MPDTRHRFRKIHLDFHTSPLISDVGADFDGEAFAGTLEAARVNYVVCFAKCHHGMCYYDAAAGVKHPALTFDLLGAQLEACHRRDIAVSAYFSVVWEEEAARQHPEWQQLGPDGTPRHTVPGRRWATVCLNSPYVEEMLIPQVDEVTRRYDVDGLWFDMIHLDENACHCEWCRRKMRDRGWSYDNDAERWQYVSESIFGFLARMSGHIRGIKPGVDIEYNSQARLGARFSAPYVTNFEIECTPSERGYLYFGLFARHVRTAGPIRGVTPRFHRIWADFGSMKSVTQLQWEMATMLAAGAQCSIGDQMAPRGRLDDAVYGRIGTAYREVEACEPWCRDAVPVTETAVLTDDSHEEFGISAAPNAVWGAARMLVELHCQFDIVDRTADFARYRLLVLPDNQEIDAALTEKIRAYLASGGRVLACGLAGSPLLPHLGVREAGVTEYTANYLRLADDFRGEMEAFDYVVRRRCVQVEPAAGSTVLAQMVWPYFERTPEHFTSHHHAPARHVSPYPAIVRAGAVICLAAPLFAAYHTDGDTHCRQIVARCLEALLPDRLVQVDGLPMLEAGLMRQQGRLVLHLVNYAAGKRGAAPETIDVIPPLYRVPVRVRAAGQRVMLAPSGEELPFTMRNGCLCFTVPEIGVHQLIVIEE